VPLLTLRAAANRGQRADMSLAAVLSLPSVSPLSSTNPRSPAALTGVAGTAVLGIRVTLLGWSWAGIALLAIAVAFWLVLLTPVLTRWATPTVGAPWC